MASTFEFARRAQNRGAAELATILAGPPPGALSMSGGFPNPETFPTADLDEIVARLLRDEPGVALQYAPSEGIPSVREYLLDRQEHLQGRRPEPAELTVTSGGMECIALLCQALLDPGDSVAVEAPTYLGALMAFAQAEADVIGIEMDDGGLVVEALEERLEAGARPKLLYVIPEYQNPSGWTLALERREPLIELCRRHGVLIVEDVAYREMAFDTDTRAAVAVVARAGRRAAGRHVLEDLLPRRAARLGGRAGRGRRAARGGEAADRPVRRRARPADGRGVRPRRALRPPAPAGPRALRRALARAVGGARARARRRLHAGASRPAASSPGSTLPEGLDSIELRPAAVEAGVTYVPGPPFYSGDDGHGELRLSFSHLGAGEYDEAVRRLASVHPLAVSAGSVARKRPLLRSRA